MLQTTKIIPYTSNIILDNNNPYGIVKTETVIRLANNDGNFVNDNINSTVRMNWYFRDGVTGKTVFQDPNSSRSLKHALTTTQPLERSKKAKAQGKKHKGKLKKCILKLFKKGNKGKRKKNKHKKYMMPLIMGLLAAKALLILLTLKALVFIAAKGLLLAFFSTMFASVISLKGMFAHSHGWNRKDDSKTQVEIIQIPSHNDGHAYYENYKRGDFRVNN